jgi:peptidoglycan/xylan/chitin deacetylase (PgdA/CDA1 family)
VTKPRRGQCVLTLHRVVASPELDHDLSLSAFLALLDGIGSQGVAVSASLARPEREPGSVVLTLDDATADHRRVAEELASRGLSALFFVPVSSLGAESRLGPSDVQRLVEIGHVVGSHSLDHRRLETMDPAELVRQVTESRIRLEALTGTPVDVFAPPGGSDHPFLARVLEDAGYSASRSTRWGFYESSEARWRVPCLPVTEFTWRRGWIERAIAEWRRPPAMWAVWQMKRGLPQRALVRLRARALRSD